MNASITELTCSILKRFRVLEPGRVVVSVAHRRPTPPLMLVVEKPVLHLNHWTLGHVVDNKNFPNSTNTNTQNGEPQKKFVSSVWASFVGESTKKQGPGEA